MKRELTYDYDERGADEKQMMVVDSEGQGRRERAKDVGRLEQMQRKGCTRVYFIFFGLSLIMIVAWRSSCVYVFEIHSLSYISIGSKVVFNKASVCVSESDLRSEFSLSDCCQRIERMFPTLLLLFSLFAVFFFSSSRLAFMTLDEEEEDHERAACEADSVMAKGDE